MFSKIDKLEMQGKFADAEILRRGKISAGRKKKVRSEINGETIASSIINKVKEDVEALLTENDLSTAIFYVNKNIEPTIKSLQDQLSSSIQEVLDSNVEPVK